MSAPIECPCCGRLKVTEWFGSKGIRLRPADAAIIEDILTRSPRSVAEVGIAESTLRFRLRKKGLPPASKWIQLSRAIAIARAVQADPGRSIERIAFSYGYSDHAAICHLLRRNLGITPAEARTVSLDLGAILDTWWEHQKRGSASRRELAGAAS
jgi:AraC-like DNA-binding protein